MADGIGDVTTSEWGSRVLSSEKPVAVDFWHENCVWCKRLDPELAAVAAERSDKIVFFKLHVFSQPEIARKYGIQGTPTIKFFCRGREVYEIVGYRPRAALVKEVDRILENYADCLRQSTEMKGQ